MNIGFELRDLHKFILTALFNEYTARQDDLFIAVELGISAAGDFEKLIKRILDDRVYWPTMAERQSRRTVQRNLRREEFEKAIQSLELLGLLIRREIRLTEVSGVTRNEIDHYIISLTEEGIRVAKAIVENRRVHLRSPEELRNTIFVASAFGYEEVDALFEAEIRPTCEAKGLIPVRVDLSEPSQTISDQVLQGIRECRYLIADLTYARPSVYFEVGVAHGMGIPLLLTCRQDHYRAANDETKIHFDLEQYKISFWTRTGDRRFSWPKNMSPSERLTRIQGFR